MDFPDPGDGSHLATRYRLMAAAARQMAYTGYAATSMRAVAAEAGVTTGAIYKQFPGGKEALFRAILDAVHEAVSRFVTEGVTGYDGPVEALVDQAGRLWDFFARFPSFGALVVRENIAGTLGDPSPFFVQQAGSIEQLRALFEMAIAEGQMAPVSVGQTLFWVTSYITSFHGCRPLRAAVFTDAELETARADFLATLRRQIEP
jgi:AcrR family transcriptional regulator